MLIMVTVLLEYIDLWYKISMRYKYPSSYADIMLDALLCWHTRGSLDWQHRK